MCMFVCVCFFSRVADADFDADVFRVYGNNKTKQNQATNTCNKEKRKNLNKIQGKR